MPRHKSGPRSGRKYPRRAKWLERRDACYFRAGGVCEVSGEDLFTVTHGDDCTGNNCTMFDDGYCKHRWHRACDHIWPERFVRRFAAGGDPHVLENLVAITPSLHARKTKIEYKIFKGDRIGYVQELRCLGFDPVVIDNAWKAICRSIKVPF